jgi:spoIIIJ-associated protein jag
VEVPEEDFEDDDFEEEEGDADYEETVDQLDEAARVTKEYLEGIAKTYGAEATVTVEARRDRMTFVFDTDKQGLLIGKHGKILNALQVLAQVSVHRFIKGRISVQVDVGDYRARRSETLQQIAERTARKVLKTKQPVYLEPLPAYERKQIHAALSKNKRISTHSEGKEPHRYLVVEIAE